MGYFITMFIVVALAFNLGMKWESMKIERGLREKGEVVSMYGDFNKHKYKIVGTVEHF